MSAVFRALVFALVAVVMGFAAPLRAQEALKPAEIAKIKAEVLVTMDNYLQTFVRKDAQAIADKLFTNPSVSVGPNGVAANTPEQNAKQYTGTIQQLVDRGWDKSVSERTDVCVVNANAAFVNIHYNRFKKDGSLLQTGAAMYLLNKGKDTWRIVLLLSHDLNKTVICSD